MKKYKVSEDEYTVWIQWGKLGKKHIGLTEEINLIGLQMLVDRDKSGRVCAIEIIKG